MCYLPASFGSEHLIPQSARPDLPLEMSDHIIDFLWDDVAALKSCTLTCKTWYPASRYHLRRHLVVRSASELQRMATQLLSLTSRTQFSCVETLHVHEDHQCPFFHTLSFFIHSSSLPSLTTLVIYDVDWHAHRHRVPHSQFYTRLSCFKNVTTVIFKNCRVSDFSDLHCVARSFPQIRSTARPQRDADSKLEGSCSFDVTFRSGAHWQVRRNLSDVVSMSFRLSGPPCPVIVTRITVSRRFYRTGMLKICKLGRHVALYYVSVLAFVSFQVMFCTKPSKRWRGYCNFELSLLFHVQSSWIGSPAAQPAPSRHSL